MWELEVQQLSLTKEDSFGGWSQHTEEGRAHGLQGEIGPSLCFLFITYCVTNCSKLNSSKQQMFITSRRWGWGIGRGLDGCSGSWVYRKKLVMDALICRLEGPLPRWLTHNGCWREASVPNQVGLSMADGVHQDRCWERERQREREPTVALRT